MPQGNGYRSLLWIGGGLLLAVLAVYGQVVGFDFVSFDDPRYVSDNAHVQAGITAQGIRWAFTTSEMGNWHPLTWLSLMLDSELGGGASTFHLTNLLLHALNSLLLFHLLTSMTGLRWHAAFVAAMFAVHPLHVESVAWVSERKDVLSGLFWFLTLLAYVRYVKRPLPRRYLALLAAFSLGLMSKPMLVTLPLILLMLDYWPLRRFAAETGQRHAPWRRARSLFWEKVPLLLLAAASATITLYAQSAAGALAAVAPFPPGLRLANAVISYTRYLSKTLWPSSLALPYPYDLDLLTAPRVWGATLLLVGISLLALRWARSRPYVWVGWSWYVITLLPVIGLVQVGSQAMADRYTYLPIIGLFIMVAWAAADLVRTKALLAAAAGLATLALAATAHVQAGHWRNTKELFAHVVRVSERNAVAHDLLGLELLRGGSLEQALHHLGEAVRIAPDYVDARSNLAAALGRAGRHAQALDQRREALRHRPRDPDTHAHLGLTLSRLGRHDEALKSFAQALRLDPGNLPALKGSGVTSTRLGRDVEAIDYLRRALELDPGDSETRVNLGTVFLRQGRLASAEAELTEALRIDPGNASAHKNLGVLLARQQRLDEAMAHFRTVLSIDPGDEAARANLERARSMLNRGENE